MSSSPFRKPQVELPPLVESKGDMLTRLAALQMKVEKQKADRDYLGELIEGLEGSADTFRAIRLPRLWQRALKVIENDTTGDKAADEATVRSCREAELFWVSDDMSKLACDAAGDLPEVHLGRDLWPTESGFMVFQWPVPIGGFKLLKAWSQDRTTEAVRAILWGPGGDGVIMTMFSDLAAAALMINRERGNAVNDGLLRDMQEWRRDHGELMPIGVGHFPIDEPIGRDYAAQEPHLAILVSTIWLLMQQPLVVEEEEHEIDLKTQRKLRRAGHRVPKVRLVELRRLRGTSTAGSTGRTYHQRWAVRGHWRRQWYPSLGMHRPTWVRPHVKGPDDLPFVPTQKVNVWKR